MKREYNELVAQKKYHKQQVKSLEEDIVSARHDLHKDFVAKNKRLFDILDIMVICLVLFNFGAVVSSSALVSSTTENITFYEVNPVNADRQGLITEADLDPEVNADDVNKKYLLVGITFVLPWLFIIWLYIWFRRYVYTEILFYPMICVVTACFILLGIDFFHDIGFIIGLI